MESNIEDRRCKLQRYLENLNFFEISTANERKDDRIEDIIPKLFMVSSLFYHEYLFYYIEMDHVIRNFIHIVVISIR